MIENLTRDKRVLATLDKYDRKRIINKAQADMRKQQPMTFIVIALPALCIVPAYALGWLVSDSVRIWYNVAVLGGSFLYTLMAVPRFLQRRRPFIMDQLFIEGIRPTDCLVCGYDLRGTVRHQCSECGQALAPVNSQTDTAGSNKTPQP